ncbi:MAG: 16S rRNA (guanine(527)-N(7))-methyltransferase RsmG [Verrucomicrobiota bacterium]
MTFDLSIINQHFPELSELQRDRLEAYCQLIAEWNQKINLIARTDVENLPKRHLLHSLAIAKVMAFKPKTNILDIGTGGGFPGIPLAILFPQCRFHLIDSIGKKIMVVQDCIERLALENATADQIRAENVSKQYEFVVARAVTQLTKFLGWIKGKFKPYSFNDLPNGVLYLKGGDLAQEFSSLQVKPTQYPIRDYFDYDEFDQKYVIHLPRKS